MRAVFTLAYVRLVFVLLCAALAAPSWSAQPDQKALSEISHLIEFVKVSGCQFNRNGSWYTPEEAASHINRKYEYVLDRGGISSAEDFIRYSATESSWSGRQYTVQCPGQDVVPSADWLKAELGHFRTAK